MVSQSVEARKFSPEQERGLKAIGYTFVTGIVPVSVGHLLEDAGTRPFLGSVCTYQEMRDVLPVARQVAVNPEQIFAPYEDRDRMPTMFGLNQGAEKYVRTMRSNVQEGTLNGVDFGMDRVSTLVQLHIALLREFGRGLVSGGLSSKTIDYLYTVKGVGSRYAIVGENIPGSKQLKVDDSEYVDGYSPFVRIVLVATPAGSR